MLESSRRISNMGLEPMFGLSSKMLFEESLLMEKGMEKEFLSGQTGVSIGESLKMESKMVMEFFIDRAIRWSMKDIGREAYFMVRESSILRMEKSLMGTLKKTNLMEKEFCIN